MPSTFTTSNRLEKQAPGENENTWAEDLNDNTIQLADEAMDGYVGFALSGSKTLTANNSATDEARKRILHATSGTGGTITIPNVPKAYIVRNDTSGAITFTTGTGTTAEIAAGGQGTVFCTGSNAIYSEALATGTENTWSAVQNHTAKFGYSEGGTVTQSTSKSTAVTLNKLTGLITTSSAALAANTSVAFVVNNTTVATTDMVMVAVDNGLDAGRYQATTGSIGTAGFHVHLRNVTSGSLSDAVDIRFMVLKSADA